MVFTKSAPNLNNYENDDGGENLDNEGQQQPLHGWKLIRKAVANQPGASSPNQTYLQGRVSKLQKLTQNIEVEHKETKLKYEYQMNLPDYTQNALPTKFAIESQMKFPKNTFDKKTTPEIYMEITCVVCLYTIPEFYNYTSKHLSDYLRSLFLF